jgi:hypothetical protein
MLITTHTPILISDSKPEKVLVFKKHKTSGTVSISQLDFNTLGASITMNACSKRETIGAYAQEILDRLHPLQCSNDDASALINEINLELGDSMEKILLIKAILDKAEGHESEGQD